jgi:AbrB family looped-hinge helix DNA binding protein
LALWELAFLTFVPYIPAMKATLTSKGQITIPAAVRKRLGLKTGQVLEFDEAAPFLKAVPAFDEKRMWATVGRAKGKWGKSSMDWLDETRGPALKRKK